MTFSPGPASFIPGPKSASPSRTRGGSRVPEWGPLGSVRGALSNERPYRDLRNVIAKYPFERPHTFPGIQPNSGQRDHSRLNCGVGKRNGASCIRNLSISKGRNGSRNFSTAWFVVLHLDAAFLAAPIGLRAFYHFLAVEPK